MGLNETENTAENVNTSLKRIQNRGGEHKNVSDTRNRGKSKTKETIKKDGTCGGWKGGGRGMQDQRGELKARSQ